MDSSPVASSSGISGAVGELKIKGQAEVERRKSKWERQEDDRVSFDRWFFLLGGEGLICKAGRPELD
jgi:hypothetical protein